jgi:predicted Rossmann-fold nucleotide-binding protein
MNAGERYITLPADLPYDPLRDSLYTREELMSGWPAETLDERIQRHVLANGFRSPPTAEALAQRLHDHHIDVALSARLCEKPRARIVGVMGSAATPRDDPWYRRVAELSRALALAGYLVASGGGPGSMEAANLGAFLADHDDAALDQALDILTRAPAYEDDMRPYMAAAAEAYEALAPGAPSIAIPTWFYPGEPVGQFASDVAKYFANSIREDGLLTIALAGVVFAPGRAGTIQELFQDAAQNAYGIRGRSPMVLYGREHYDSNPSIYALLRAQALRFGAYEGLVTLADEPATALEFLRAHEPAAALEALHECEPEGVLSFLRNERNSAR